jgi:uncharacterized RDD family membrane protein YckC
VTRTEPRPDPGAPSPDAPLPPDPPAPAGDARFPWRAVPVSLPVAPSARETAHGRPAGVVTRAAANAVDVALVLLVLTLGYAGWAGFRLLLDPTAFRLSAPEYEWVVLAVGIGLVLYWTVTWAGLGRTHGDQFMGLRVVGRNGGRLHFLHAALRAVLCVLFLPGLFWVLVSRRNRSVQDVVLRTAVVYD